jgi:p-cumate 2,3-dioxygenase subunit alpha
MNQIATSAENPLIVVDREKQRFRINRNNYKSPEIFEKEKELIFNRCWLYLGHATELRQPGDYVTRRVAGRELIFTRSRNGEVNAFYNSCTHRGATLCRERSGNSKSYTCCYHGWVFANDGKLLSLNTDHGFPADLNADGCLNLRKVARLEDYRGFFFVNFNPRAISLFDYLAGVRDSIDSICDQSESEMVILPGEHSYSIKANYKFLIENSSDGYHLFPVHASYFDFLRDRYKGTKDANAVDEIIKGYYGMGKVRCLGNGHTVLESVVPTGRPVAQWIEPWGPVVKKEIDATRDRLEKKFGTERMKFISEVQKNIIVFPNLVINDIMSITVRTIEPESANFMKVTAWALGPKEESEQLRAMRLDNFVSFLGPAGFGSPDDIEMLEICQKGIESSPIEWTELSKGMAAPGDLLTRTGGPDDEVQFQAFWAQWDAMMRNIETLEA